MTDSGPVSTRHGGLNDETISAFVDGQIESAAERDRIGELARNDPEVQARVAAYQTQKRAIRAAFDGTLQEPLPLPLLQRRRTPRSAYAWRAAAAVVLFVTGAGAGAWLLPRVAAPPPTVVAMNAPAAPATTDALGSNQIAEQTKTLSLSSSQDAMAKDARAANEAAPTSVAVGEIQNLADQPSDFVDQALTAYESGGSTSQTSTAANSLDATSAGRDKPAEADALARSDAAVDLSALGFHPVAANAIFGDNTARAGGGPAVFVDAKGRRVILFSRPTTASLPAPGLQWREHGSLRAVAWSSSNGTFALVGPLDHDEMLALARAVIGQTFN